MVIDATKRGSIPHDSDFQNLLSETLTTFLTSILGKRRTSFLEKSREVILYLLEARGNEGYPSQISDHYGHGRKRYQDIIQTLKKAGLIKVLPKISNYSPILLNDNVRVYLNKIVGGKIYNERIINNLINMDGFNEDEIKMEVDAAETIKDAFDLGYIKDKGYISNEAIDKLQTLIDAEKQANNIWEKSMARHYQLEFMTMLLFNIVDDLMERIEELEGNK